MHDLLNGTLDLAFVTGLPDTARLTSVLVSDQTFFVVMLNDDRLAAQSEVSTNDLEDTSCVLFERHVHPFLYDDVVRVTRPASKSGCSLHHVMSAEDAAQFVRRGFGVAVLTQAGAWRIARAGLTMRSLNADGLRVQTRLTCRSDGLKSNCSGFRPDLYDLDRTEEPPPSRWVCVWLHEDSLLDQVFDHNHVQGTGSTTFGAFKDSGYHRVFCHIVAATVAPQYAHLWTDLKRGLLAESCSGWF